MENDQVNSGEVKPEEGDQSNGQNQSGGTGDSGPAQFSSVALLDEITQGAAPVVGTIAAPYGLRADGTPRAKPGRRLGQKTGMSAAAVSASSPGTAAAAAPRVRSKAEAKAHEAASTEVARAVFAVSVGTAVSLIGEEWAPSSQQEADGMRAAIAAYIEAKGEGKLSPEAMLALCVLGYSAARLEHENTRRKLGGFVGKLWGWTKTAYKALFTR